MKKRARIVSGLAALAALFLAPIAQASLTRSNTPAREAPALALTLAAPELSEFSLFDGTEIARALASRPALISISTDEEQTAVRTRFVSPSELSADELPDGPELVPITGVREQPFNLQLSPGVFGLEPLRGPPGDEASYPKTRYRVFGLLGTPILGELRGVSLELHWRSASFSCGFASGTVGWLSQDPLGDKDSPNLYGFVGARPHELTDPMGTCAELDDIPCGEYLKEFGDQFLFQNLWETTKRSGRFLLGEGKGAVKAVPNLAKGVAHVAMHPVRTIQALGTAAGEAIADPTGTAKRLGNSLMNADPDKAAEFTGGALALAGLGAAAKTTEGLAALGRLGRAGEVVEAVEGGSGLAKYGDLGYVEGVAARASRFALRRAQAGGVTGRVAGKKAEEIFEKYAYQLEQRLMAAESPLRITLQPAADAATGARALARTRGSFVGRWVSGTKRLDYGFYESASGGANSSRILSGGDFTVSPGGAFGIPAEYSQAFPGATIFGIDPLNIVKGP